MAYEPLNLQNGQTLTAEDLQHIEQGISGVLPQNPGAYQYPATDGDGNMVWVDRLAYEQSGQIIAEVQTCVTEDIGEYGQAWGSVQAVNTPVLEEGTVYTVYLDGTYYPCEVVLNRDDNAFVGNYSIIDSYETDNGLPFVLDVWNDGLVQVVTRTPGSYEFGLTLGETTVKTIDPKFLPDIRGTAFYVNVTQTDTDTYTADKTYAEISNAIANGLIPYCVYGNYLLPMVLSNSGALSGIAPAAVPSFSVHIFSAIAPMTNNDTQYAIVSVKINEIDQVSYQYHAYSYDSTSN